MINLNKKDAVTDAVKSILTKEEIDVNARTKDDIGGRKKSGQKDDVGPAADSKSTKVRFHPGPKNEEVVTEGEKSEKVLAKSKPVSIEKKEGPEAGESVDTQVKKENKALRGFKEKYEQHSIIDQMINEVLSKDASAGQWIEDFVKSDNPKFAGKSKAQRKKQALAAYYAKQKNEEVEGVDEAAFWGQDKLADKMKQNAAGGTSTVRDLDSKGKVKTTTTKVPAGKKVKEEVEVVYEANIEPTNAKSRTHIGNLSNPTVNSVVHPSSGKEIGLITKQPSGEYHAHHSAAKLSHAASSTFDSKDKAHQFVRDAHAKATKNGTLSDNWLKKKPLPHLSKEEVESVEEGVGDTVKTSLKKFLSKVGGGSDEDQRKRLQKNMGVPQTGKPNHAKYNEETEQVEEGWDDMVKSAKDTLKDKPQDGGSGVKKGSRYGGSKQKDEKEPVKEECHTPMSRAKTLAKLAMGKMKKELGQKGK